MSMLLEPPIVLRGELTMADMAAANRLLQSKRPRKVVPALYVAVASLIVAFGIMLHDFDVEWTDWAFGGAIVGFGLLLGGRSLLARYKLHQSWKRKDGVFRQVDTTITTEGLLITEPHSVIKVEWAHFFGAVTAPTVIFLFPKDGWILFGRSRFTDERDWNRFKAFVEDRWPVAPRFA